MSGLVTSISNMFRNVQQVAAPAPANPMAQNNPSADPTLNPPAPPATPAAPANPLDEFKSIWQTPDPATVEPDPLAAPLLNVDPKKIQQAAARMDFTSGLAPELLQKAMSGQDPQAFIAVMNSVAQQAVATAAQLSSATVEHATRANNQRMLTALPKHVQQVQLDSIQSENPILQHPSAQPLLKMLKGQIQASEPNLRPAEVAAKAEQFLTTFGAALAPAPAPAAVAPGEVDWDRYGSM